MAKQHFSHRVSADVWDVLTRTAEARGVTRGAAMEQLVREAAGLPSPDPIAADYVTRQAVDALVARLDAVEARLFEQETIGTTHVTSGGAVRVTFAEDFLAAAGESIRKQRLEGEG